MPTVRWTLTHDRPHIEVTLTRSKPPLVRRLIADTGAGTRQAAFQLVLDEQECLRSRGKLVGQVTLGGAFSGQFPVFLVEVNIPALNFLDSVPIVGVKQVPPDFDGIACFRFLNRFHYGNFGDSGKFGLE